MKTIRIDIEDDRLEFFLELLNSFKKGMIKNISVESHKEEGN